MKWLNSQRFSTRLKAQSGDATLSQYRVFTWARQFKGGRESVEIKSQDWCPRSSLTDDNVHAVQELIEGDRLLTVNEMHWENLDHPPYSPDLTPCDYFLFAPMKESLGGERLKKNDEVEEYVHNWWRHTLKLFLKGMFKLPNRWQKCVECTAG